MKKNLLIGLLVLICGLFCVLGLAACKEEEKPEEGGTVSVENVSQLIDSYGEQTKSFLVNEVIGKAMPSAETSFNAENVLGSTVDLGDVQGTELKSAKVILLYADNLADRTYKVIEVKFSAPVALSDIASYSSGNAESADFAADAEVTELYEEEFNILDYAYNNSTFADAVYQKVIKSSETPVNLMLIDKGMYSYDFEGDTLFTECYRYRLIVQTDKTVKAYYVIVKIKDSEEEIIESLNDETNYKILETQDITALTSPFTVTSYVKEGTNDIPEAAYFLTYESYGAGYAVTGIDKRYKGTPAVDIDIPSEYQDAPVVYIDEFAFVNNEMLTSVSIPDSVTSIGRDAFSGCINLNKVTFGRGLTTIGNDAFSDCDSLEEIHIPDLKLWCGMDFTTDSFRQGSSPFANGSKLYINDQLITDLVITDDITTISNGAFIGCSSIESLTIGSGTTEIGNFAFKDCVALKNLTVSDSVTTVGMNSFDNCEIETAVVPSIVLSRISVDYLKSIEILNGDKIEDYMFNGCDALEEVTIPEGITIIGNSAFRECSSLTEIVLPASVTRIETSAFTNCTALKRVTIPDGLTYIDTEAFANCPLEKATVPALALEAIAKDTVREIVITSGEVIKKLNPCNALESITIADGARSIADKAFYGCYSLKDIVLPDSVTSIGKEAFYNCSSIQSIVIPAGVTSIGSGAFENCTALTDLTIEDGASNISQSAFTNCHIKNAVLPAYAISLFDKDKLETVDIMGGEIPDNAFDSCALLKKVTLRDGVTRIGAYAFNNCSLITELVIPDTVTELGSNAFTGCRVENLTTPDLAIVNRHFSQTYLKSVVVKGGDTVPMQIFYDYDKLESIILPETITSIEAYAFYGCSSLKSITIPANVTSIQANAFTGCTSLVSAIFENPRGWSEYAVGKLFVGLEDPQTAAQCLTYTYNTKYWVRNPNYK